MNHSSDSTIWEKYINNPWGKSVSARAAGMKTAPSHNLFHSVLVNIMEQNPIQNTGKMETSRNYPDGVPCFEDHLNGLQLHVRDLSFCPPISLFHRVTDWIQPYLRKIQQTKSATHINSCLQNVNFTCYGGELTAVVGNDDERSSLIHLLAGRLTTGEFDGDIVLTSPCMSSKSYYYDNVTFVQKVRKIIPVISHLTSQLL